MDPELQGLGLVDPNTGATDQTPSSSEPVVSDPANSTPVDQNSAPVVQTPVVPAVNPYEQANTWYERAATQVELQASQAYAHLMRTEVAEGRMDENTLRSTLELATQAQMAKLENQKLMMAMAPTAHQEVARKIASEFSTGGVTITPEEVAQATDVQGMRARASEFHRIRRDTSYQARQAKGADRVEGTSPSGGFDPKRYENMSGFDLIRAGLTEQR